MMTRRRKERMRRYLNRVSRERKRWPADVMYWDRDTKPLVTFKATRTPHGRDKLRHARSLHSPDYARVRVTRIPPEISVSTVWIGADSGFFGRPMIFETCVFWHGGKSWQTVQQYTYLREARIGHRAFAQLAGAVARAAVAAGKPASEYFDHVLSDPYEQTEGTDDVTT